MGRAAGGRGRRVTDGPMRGVILSKDRARKASKKHGGQARANAWHIELKVNRELAYDLDMRRIVDHVSVRMMEYFSKAMRAGKKADGGGTLPMTKRVRDRRPWGLRTGYMADHWWRGKIRGGSFRCFVLVKPYGGDAGPEPENVEPGGRAAVINRGLEAGVDLQSIKGGALTVFRKACDEAIAAGFGDVTNNPSIRTNEGLLPQLRGAG